MAEQSTNARWWDEDKGQAHDAVAHVFRVVRTESEWQRDADEFHACLYSATESAGVYGLSRSDHQYGPTRLPYNVCRSAVDTLQAKITTQRPLPQCLAQRGQWKSQKKARRMTQFLEGEFYKQRFFENHWRGWVRDALIFGRGLLKIWTEGKRITTERIHPWEVHVDEWDARYGAPRNMYHCRSMDRGNAIALFGKRDAIEKAGRFEPENSAADYSNTVDRVDVVEAWHLPGPDGKGGRHVIIVQGATLLDEPWTYEYFPFVMLGYNDPVCGYWPTGLVAQLEGYQYELNLASETLREQYRMSGVLVTVPDGAGIHDQQIRNGVHILRHRPGGEVRVNHMDLVNEHMRARPRELTQDALNDAGISQMSAQSQKPSGIQSGIALQTMDDIETERFHVFARAAESAVLEVARRYVDCAKRIAGKFDDLSVSVPMKGGLLELNWKDVFIDGVEIRVFPTSMLPQQLGARLERLKDLWNTGVIDRATFMRHLEAPDMQAEMDLETADRLVVDEILERLMDAEPGKDPERAEQETYMGPTPYQDLAWAAKRAQQKLNRGILDGMPEWNQSLLRRFLRDAKAEMAKAQNDAQAPAPQPGAPAGPPPPPTAQPPELAGLGIPGTAPPVAA